ncbi:Hypothetical protein BRZCDTV_130 [Brazilian cedratvirus IHUMI]|uniref:Uncharacterized protein n=1 Tax=Brazilian cedratvirus IHUMI TaxID=2126980 RepID=A0A2R8FDJ5_9VIRU|nr:Hypothetical protein BRZCDTV_130 [Brazilian cedratvirus IHUMI]
MEDDLNMFIRFRSVSSDFLDLAHRVGAPIKFNYHCLQALSYHRLFPVTTLALLTKSATLPKKINKALIFIRDTDLHIKAGHLQSLYLETGYVYSVKISIDVQSVDKLEIRGQTVFFPLKFPARELEIYSSCDTSLLDLSHVERLYIKGYSGLSGGWPVLPRLKYLTEKTKGPNLRPMSTHLFPSLRRLIRNSSSNKIFEGEALLIHSTSAFEQRSGPGYDLYLTNDSTKVPSKKNVIYLVNKVEEEDILPLTKKNVRLFADLEITPEIRKIIKILCGEAKIYLRGQVRTW